MKRIDRIKLFLRKAANYTGPTPHMSFEAYKALNPLPGDKPTLPGGIPKDLADLFTEEELGGSFVRSRDLSKIPANLRNLFTDKELGLSDDPKGNTLPEDLENKILQGSATLSIGAKDEQGKNLVSKVQKLLAKHGYVITSDGIFGPETERVLRSFQKNNAGAGIRESGKVDSNTLKALQKPSAKGPSSSITEQEAKRQRAKGYNAPTVSGSGRVSASQLYADLMAGLANPNLCKAMVANAIGESALHYNINGDCGSYAKSKGRLAIDTSLYPEAFSKPRRGKCCSFGLWQYNICGGLGNSLLKANGVNSSSSDEDKIAVLTSYDKQLKFMIAHVKNHPKRPKTEKSVDWWVKWFVVRVERPKNPAGATAKRQQIARGLNFA